LRFLPSSLCSESLERLVGPSARASVCVSLISSAAGAPRRGRRQSSFVGVWGLSAPTISPHHNPDLPARPEDFRKSPDHEPEIPENIRINCTRFSRKVRSATRQFPKKIDPTPDLQKNRSPPSPTSRSEKKLIAPIDFKTGRGGLFYSSVTAFSSTEVSDETGWSVRSFSKPIGPANFKIDRGDPQHTRIKGGPLPLLHVPQKK
jgi:hypothetical protein